MKIWLVGAKGMLGTALRERIALRQLSLVSTDAELDVVDLAGLLAFAQRERPTHILNAAAYTRVDDAETQQEAAFMVNALGPEHLARAAVSVGAVLLHVSTDYVFDGNSRTPYTESSLTGPTGAYGRTKLEGEQRLLGVPGAERLAYIVRTSWLFGENGPSFPRTIVKLLAERDELRVVADQVGRPTYTGDLAEATLLLAGLGGGSAVAPGCYHFANAGETTWCSFATTIRELCVTLGRPVRATRVVPVTTAEFPRPARRPVYSVLDTTRIEAVLGVRPRPWPEPLREFLERIER
jgi:dTDP-4-dehydrorhamnose reductase